MEKLNYENLPVQESSPKEVDQSPATSTENDLFVYRLIGKRELLFVTGRSYSAIYEEMRRGTFPTSVRVGGRVFWRWSEVKQWLDELPRSQYRSADPTANGKEKVDQ